MSEVSQRLIGSLVGVCVADALTEAAGEGSPRDAIPLTHSAIGRWSGAAENVLRLCEAILCSGDFRLSEAVFEYPAGPHPSVDARFESAAIAMALTSLRYPFDMVEAAVRDLGAHERVDKPAIDAAVAFSSQLRGVLRPGIDLVSFGARSSGDREFDLRMRDVDFGSSYAKMVRTALSQHSPRGHVLMLGALAGAQSSIGGIPVAWTNSVHSPFVPARDFTYWRDRLWSLAYSLDYLTGAVRGPQEVLPGLYAANLEGALTSPRDWTLLSLCRLEADPGHLRRLEFYLDDRDEPDSNVALHFVLDELVQAIERHLAVGRKVLVHCHSGGSRTGLALRAWLMWRRRMSSSAATDFVRGVWPHVHTANHAFTRALAEHIWPAKAHHLDGHDLP